MGGLPTMPINANCSASSRECSTG